MIDESKRGAVISRGMLMVCGWACLSVGCGGSNIESSGPWDVPEVPYVVTVIHDEPEPAGQDEGEADEGATDTSRPQRVPTEGEDPPGRSDLQPWVIVRLNDGQRFELSAPDDAGDFDDATLEVARGAFAFGRSGESHDVHPRLLLLLYGAVRHFEASYLLLSSGFRPGQITSYHAHGRAADFRMPGVGFLELAEHLRWQGFVGVGVYPGTRSVHLDVRPQSFFWAGYESLGEEGPEQPILHDQARQADRLARERGVTPPEPLPPEVVRQRMMRHRRLYRPEQQDRSR